MNTPYVATQSRLVFQPDGWDRLLRIGLVVPHADVGPEAEIAAMAGAHISIHGCRMNFSAMRAGGEMDEKIPHVAVESFIEPPLVDHAVEAICTAPLDAVGLAFTSSAYKHGPAGERALLERLKPRARQIPLVTTCLAAEQAFAELDSSRIAIVNPAWFDHELSALGAAYFEAAGFRVAYHGACGLPSGQRYVTPQSLYDWIATVAVKSGADTIFVSGNGHRSVGIIDAVEQQLGVKMVTSNQVLLWSALQWIGSKLTLPGYGKLLAG